MIPTPRCRTTLLTAIFLILLPPLFFWRETLGQLTLGQADILSQFFPNQALAFQILREGSAPLWNPYLYSGTPLFAQMQQGLLDPLNWVFLFGVTSRTLTIAQELSFVLSLIAMFAFMRRLGLARRAGVFAAVIYSLGGFALARSAYPGQVRVYALAPLVLLFIERLREQGRWRDAAFGALIVAWQLFVGHPQPFVYSSLLAAFYTLFCALRGSQSHYHGKIPDQPPRLRFLVQSAVMFLSGAMLSAIQLIPAWEAANLSGRRQLTYEFFTEQSLHPLTLLNTLFPFFHGQGSAIYDLPYWGLYWTHNEGQFYLGVIAMSLAAGAGLGLRRERSGQVQFWSAAAAVGVLCAMGKYVWPLAWALYHIPFLNRFRSPNRHWMEVALAVAVLSGFAIDHFLRKRDQRVARIAVIAAFTLTSVCCGAAAFVLWRKDSAEGVIRTLPDLHILRPGFLQGAGAEFYVPAVTATIITMALIAFLRSSHREKWLAILLALLIADYNLYAAFAPINNRPRLESDIGAIIPKELAEGQSERAPFRYHLLLKSDEGEFNPFWFAFHEMATGYDPLLNERYKTFTGVNEAGRSERLSMIEARDRTLDILNVRYLLVPSPLLEPARASGGEIEYGGIGFAGDQSSSAELRSGQSAVFSIASGYADTLAIVSGLANAAETGDGEEVAEIIAGCDSGQQARLSLRAGQDTAEWAYDRADVLRAIKHRRAVIAESWPGDRGGGFRAHSYLARLALPNEVSQCGSHRFVKITSSARDQVTLSIRKVALSDSTSGRSLHASRSVRADLSDRARWRETALSKPIPGYQGIRVYENLRPMPRVWLAPRIAIKTEEEQLRFIRGEPAEDAGEPFDPGSVALVDRNAAAQFDLSALTNSESSQPPGSALILKRSPNSMTILAETTRPAMLVMSEIDFPGWVAKVDGKETTLIRTNYYLRGIPLPAGKHTIEALYRPKSLIAGATVSAIAVLLICLMVLTKQRLRSKIT